MMSILLSQCAPLLNNEQQRLYLEVYLEELVHKGKGAPFLGELYLSPAVCVEEREGGRT